MNKILMKQEEYLQCREKEQKLWMELMEAELTEVQLRMLDRFLAAQNETDSYYGEVSYEQGMRDGMNLVKEVEEMIVRGI